jgi:WD40 repeat protein
LASLLTSSKDGPIPSVAGYEILDVLGHGGMGVVYKARHLVLKRTVALKMMLTGGHVRPRDLERFRAEAEAVARLQHPNIVQIHEVGESGGHPYCALEYVEGGTLAARLNGQPLPIRDTAKLVETLARAVQLAHSHNVVHRDLKPANVLLSIDGTPKIADFGLARKLDSDSGETRAGAVMGTPSYMAPEQASGRSHDAGPAADIYALGAILYECLTGRPPFKADVVDDTLEQVRTREPISPSVLQANVPFDLETICLKCLRKEPENRYPSAAEVADDLLRFQKGEPILARPVGRAEKLWRWSRRNPALAAATLLTASALIAVAIVSAAFAVRERKHAQEIAAALHASEENRRNADYRLAESYLDRGITLCERGEVAQGLLWLVNGLETAPLDAAELQYALRANLADWARLLPPLRGIFRYPGTATGQIVSPDARSVLVVNAEGGAEIWDAANGRRRFEVGKNDGEIAAAFSDDGHALALVRMSDGAGRIWNPITGQWTGAPLPPHGRIKAVALNAGAKYVLTVSSDEIVRIWDGVTAKPQAEFRPHAGPVSSAVFTPGGQAILTTSGSEARLWATATGYAIGAPLPHTQSIAATAFSSDGRYVITGGWDRVAQVWSVTTGKAVGGPIKHPKPVAVVALSPDGRVAFVGGDATGRLWNVAEGTTVGVPLMHRNYVVAATFSPNGKTLLTGGLDASAHLWDAVTGRPQGPELLHGHTVQTVLFDSAGRQFLTESRDGLVRVWDMVDDVPPPVALPVPEKLRVIGLGSDGAIAFTGTGEAGQGEARIWSVTNGTPLCDVFPHAAPVSAMAFSSDGKHVLTAAEDGMVRLWDAGTSQPVGLTVRTKYPVRSVAFGADGKTIITAGGDGMVQRWDQSSGTAVGAPWKLDGNVLAMAPSPDGRFILAGCSDSTAVFWNLEEHTTSTPMRHRDWVISVALSPDGKTALTGSDDRTARLWDVASGRPLGQPLVHQNAICGVAFSVDGRTVATGSEDNTVRRWDVATGKSIGPALMHPDWVMAVGLRSDGRSLVTGCADRSIRVWKLPSAAEGTTERLRLWVQEYTGQKLDASGAVNLIDTADWHERRNRLRTLDER